MDAESVNGWIKFKLQVDAFLRHLGLVYENWEGKPIRQIQVNTF